MHITFPCSGLNNYQERIPHRYLSTLTLILQETRRSFMHPFAENQHYFAIMLMEKGHLPDK